MHSSRMRTGRSLTVCWRLLPGGGGGALVPRGSARGVSALGGVCFWRGASAPRGSSAPRWGGVWSRGGVVSAWGVYSQEGSGPGDGGIPACTEGDTLPPVD